MAQGFTSDIPISTDTSLSPGSNGLVPSQAAVKTYVDNKFIADPGTVTDNALVRWDGSTGLLVQDSTVLVSDAGEMTNGSQPAVYAFLPANDDLVTGDGTAFTIGSGSAWTKVFDQGGDFVTTGTFTAPVTGRYRILLRVTASTGSGNGTATQWIQILTSNRTLLYSLPTRDQCIGFYGINARAYLESSQLFDMDAGDTATFVYNCNGAASKVAGLIGGVGSTNATSVSIQLEC